MDLVPMFKVDWNGYTAQEEARRTELRRLDCIMVAIFAAWYLLQATFVTSTTAAVAAPASVGVLAVRTLLAVAAPYVLAVHIFSMPAPTASDEAWTVQSAGGRWVYLTRHALTLQAWHQILSLASLALPQLDALTHGMSIWIACLGWFVSVQYFVLVEPSQSFKDACAVWKERGVQFREIGILLHAPALPIAVLDLLAGKDGAMLREAVTPLGTVGLLVAYVLLYLCLITLNYNVVGLWPYGFMTAFGTDVRKWATFIVGQVGVLSVFFIINLTVWYLRTAA